MLLIRLLPLRFFWSLVEHPPVTVPKIHQRANQYMPAPGTLEKKNGEARANHLEAATGSLNSTQMEIFLQIQEKDLLQVPNPIETRSEEQDRRCYYRFHRSYGHDTEECYDLKN
ncbi:hypothetical protein GW17_00030683 [Ensete ventricosum]|nr:hypothetical protein GW17_00030683 [Ensete ventricosum]